jgi:hypothetical protein
MEGARCGTDHPCSEGFVCHQSQCRERPEGLGADKRRLFVSSTKVTGGLGGLSGADGLCQYLASDADLSGYWSAWMSDATTDAIDRVPAEGAWYSVDGSVLYFPDRDTFRYAPVSRINSDEHGQPVVNGCVWTGTWYGGRGAPDNCKDWSVPDFRSTGVVGDVAGAPPSSWTDIHASSQFRAPGQPCQYSCGVICYEL